MVRTVRTYFYGGAIKMPVVIATCPSAFHKTHWECSAALNAQPLSKANVNRSSHWFNGDDTDTKIAGRVGYHERSSGRRLAMCIGAQRVERRRQSRPRQFASYGHKTVFHGIHNAKQWNICFVGRRFIIGFPYLLK